MSIATRRNLRCTTALVGAFSLMVSAGVARAQERTYHFSMSAEPLSKALRDFARTTHQQLVFTEAMTNGKTAPAIDGSLPPAEALDRLLTGSGLSAERTPDGAWIIHRSEGTRPQDAGAEAGRDASIVSAVVVTAEKRPERLQDVPMAASVITGSQLMATQATTLQDVVNATPGVQLISGTPVTNEVVIRGISVGSGVNTSVATYVDEVPYTADGPFSLGASSAPNFDTYDLSRIEVLRGPQGTLYGANALGGLLKYVTNAPDPSGYSASFLTGINSVGHSGQPGLEAHGMVNLPLGDDAALRVVGYDTYFPGYIDDPSRGVKDINDVRRDGVRASFLWEPIQNLSVRLSANYQNLTSGDFGTEDVSAATLKPLFGDLTQERALPQPLSETNQIYNATINWNLGFGTLVSSSSYTETKTTLQEDATAEVGPLTPLFFGRSLDVAATVTAPVQTFTQEVRLSSPSNQKLEWTAGFYFDDQSADDAQLDVPADPNTGQILNNLSAIDTANITSTYLEYAGFGDLTYHFTSAFEVTAGGRFSSNSQTSHEVTGGALAHLEDAVENLHTDSSQSVFTYSVDAKYRFNPDIMTYARIATGFVPGGPNDLVVGATVPSTFKSSTTTNYEVGIKGNAAEGRFTYDFDAFDVEWQDIQLNAIVNQSEFVANGGAARSNGVEGDLGFVPVQGLTIDLNGAYTNARLTQNTPVSFGGLAGDRLPLSPYFAGTAAISYEHPLWGDVSGFAGLEWHYNGERLTEFLDGLPRENLPAYSMVDLHAGVNIHAFTFTVYVKNAEDVRIINASPVTLAPGGPLSATVAQPRTIGVQVAAKF
jgi:iron complex outermembrane recepter protein